jgi:plastocyanin
MTSLPPLNEWWGHGTVSAKKPGASMPGRPTETSLHSTLFSRRLAAALALTLAAPFPSAALAASLNADIRDASGNPLADAVVYAETAGGGAARTKREVHIEQIDKTFVPHVTVVQTGTAVNFPNRDSIRHHVYSFSPAKTFEIKLFSGVPANPVTFDKAGEVVLGCNIHDQMIAYVLVVDTPYFAKTGKDGKAKFENLPAGNYRIKVWHHAAEAPAPQAVQLQADASREIAHKLAPRSQVPRPERK